MSEINSTRVCSLCRKEKNLGEFYNSKRSKDGKWIYCKDCAREYRENHKKTDKYKNWLERTKGEKLSKRREYMKTERYREWDERTKKERTEKTRNRNIKRKYGITSEDYEQLLASQDFRCAICRTDKAGGSHGFFQIDHCHKTNKIRGLLCWSCNVGLGKLGDTVEYLERAVEYLKGLPGLVI